MSNNKDLTVNQLMKKLTEMKKLGLGDAVVVMEGCDCDGKAGTVESKKMTMFDGGHSKATKVVYLGRTDAH